MTNIEEEFITAAVDAFVTKAVVAVATDPLLTDNEINFDHPITKEKGAVHLNSKGFHSMGEKIIVRNGKNIVISDNGIENARIAKMIKDSCSSVKLNNMILTLGVYHLFTCVGCIVHVPKSYSFPENVQDARGNIFIVAEQ